MFARILIAVLLIAMPARLDADSQTERIAIIVHPSREASLSKDEIAQIFLRKRRHWTGGAVIVPVNREAESWQRETFTRVVFDSEVRQLELYWNRQYYKGILPPATLASDEAVKRFVSLNPKAIGYIREGLVDESIRVIHLLDHTKSDG